MGFKSKKGQDNKGASGTKTKQETRRPGDLLIGTITEFISLLAWN